MEENKIEQKPQFSTRLSREMWDKLNAYCKKRGLKKSYVVEEALAAYIDSDGIVEEEVYG